MSKNISGDMSRNMASHLSGNWSIYLSKDLLRTLSENHPELCTELCPENLPNRHRLAHESRKNFGRRPTSVGP
jgi:hypothetical protein